MEQSDVTTTNPEQTQEAPSTGQVVDDQHQAATTPEQQDPAAGNTTPAGDDAPAQEAGKSDPRVKRANAEAARYRTELRDQQTQFEELKNGIAKLFGNGGDNADPAEALQQAHAERDQLHSELRTLRIETALTRQAAGKADPTILIPFLKGTGALDNLDPSADDYATQVEALVSDTLTAHPQFSTTQAVPRKTSGTSTPTDPENGPISRADLERMTSREIYDAQKAGKLKHLYT